MTVQRFSLNPFWLRRQEAVLMFLVGALPLKLGAWLRQMFYRPLFARLGSAVCIQPQVEFVCANRIEIGNDVYLSRGGRINCGGRESYIRIGDRVRIDRDVDLKGEKAHAYIEIGEGTSIGAQSCFAGRGSIRIGRDCLIAPQVGIYSSNHNFADPTRTIRSQGVSCEGVVIGDDCWLGCGVKVLDGVTIGQGCVIGAGAVVTKSIPPYSIAVGVPARVISQRSTIAKQHQAGEIHALLSTPSLP